MIAPAAGVLRVFFNGLGAENQTEGLGQGAIDFFLSAGIYHAADFGEEEGGNVMGIHRPGAGMSFLEKSIRLLIGEYEVDAAIEGLGVWPLGGEVAFG